VNCKNAKQLNLSNIKIENSIRTAYFFLIRLIISIFSKINIFHYLIMVFTFFNINKFDVYIYTYRFVYIINFVINKFVISDIDFSVAICVTFHLLIITHFV